MIFCQTTAVSHDTAKASGSGRQDGVKSYFYKSVLIFLTFIPGGHDFLNRPIFERAIIQIKWGERWMARSLRTSWNLQKLYKYLCCHFFCMVKIPGNNLYIITFSFHKLWSETKVTHVTHSKVFVHSLLCQFIIMSLMSGGSGIEFTVQHVAGGKENHGQTLHFLAAIRVNAAEIYFYLAVRK